MPANPDWFRNVKESPSTNPKLKDGLFVEKVAPKSPGLDIGRHADQRKLR